MNKSKIMYAAICSAILGCNAASATTNAGNVTAQGSGSCSAITGTFPAFGAVTTINGKTVYTVTLLITPKGGTLQTVEDLFTPANNNALQSIDTQLFGNTAGTYTGAIGVNGFAVLVLGSTGTASGTKVTLDTPIPGAADCVITLYGQLYFTA